MKTTKRIMAALLSAAVMGALSAVSFAEEAPEGHIVFAADKNTIGQGFVTEPVLVPYYEGEKGIEVVRRAAEVLTTDSGYGAFVSAFADEDTGAEIPAEITAVCPEMTGRTAEGYLSAYDYTPESGWSYFVNDEHAMTGISDYEPADGDVVWFRFTVCGYGSDLGIDNSPWGGAPALVPQTNTAELMTCLANGADHAGTAAYEEAVAVLETYGASQADIDAAHEAFDALTEFGEAADNAPADENASETGKASPDTGAEGIAAVIGVLASAGAALALSKKR